MTLYKKIKATAKKAGVKVSDLLALSPNNDPFYAGKPADVLQARWFKMVWDAAGYENSENGVHLRRVHYWCVSQENLLDHRGDRYENTDKHWSYLTQAAKMARYLQYVRIADISDNKNPPPVHKVKYSQNPMTYELVVPEIDDPEIKFFGKWYADAQPYHLEIWVEKSTMNDVLLPLCKKYHANLLTFEGEVSITATYDIGVRIEDAGKPTRVFYISDFDPAGMSMPVAMSRKVEYMLQHYNIEHEVKVKPIALNRDQVKQYRLPRTPIKETESRAKNFEDVFGRGAVELDALEALHPGVLAEIVETELSRYHSRSAFWAVQSQIDAMRGELRSRIADITAEYSEEIAAVQEMLNELRGIRLDVSDYQVERYPATVPENAGDFLFDSGREYLEQIVSYKEFKGLPTFDLTADNDDSE